MRVFITHSLVSTWHGQNLVFAHLEGLIVAPGGCDIYLPDD